MILDTTTRAVAVSNDKIYYFLTAGSGAYAIPILYVIISEIKLGDARELLSATEKKKENTQGLLKLVPSSTVLSQHILDT